MEKQLIALLTIGMLVITFTGIAFAGDDNKDKSKIDLKNVTVGGAQGDAEVKVVESDNGLHKVKIEVEVEDLNMPEMYVFEGWLVDEDSGYKLSLGAFTTHDGKADFKFKQTLVNFEIYDKLVITAEPLGDTNPNPNMPVLVGGLA